MSDAILQILLIITYLAIGLISVTFPIYAICVTYLRREKWETEKERKTRIENLKKSIAKLTKELSGEAKDSERFNQIEGQIEKYNNELESLELRIQYLTAKGAVGNPVIFLVIALITSGVGIFLFYDTRALGANQESFIIGCGVISTVFCSFALYSLYKTISAVEYAALREARSVDFVVELVQPKTGKIEFGKKAEIEIDVSTSDDDIENFITYMRIPCDLVITRYVENVVRKSTFKDHYTLVTERVLLPKNKVVVIDFDTVPKKVGEYIINVSVCGKGICTYDSSVILNVVE